MRTPSRATPGLLLVAVLLAGVRRLDRRQRADADTGAQAGRQRGAGADARPATGRP